MIVITTFDFFIHRNNGHLSKYLRWSYIIISYIQVPGAEASQPDPLPHGHEAAQSGPGLILASRS